MARSGRVTVLLDQGVARPGLPCSTRVTVLLGLHCSGSWAFVLKTLPAQLGLRSRFSELPSPPSSPTSRGSGSDVSVALSATLRKLCASSSPRPLPCGALRASAHKRHGT